MFLYLLPGSTVSQIERLTQCVIFIIGLAWQWWRFIQTPFRFQWLLLNSWSTKFKMAGFLGNNSTLVLWYQRWNQFCGKSTRFLWVQITYFFWYINNGNNLIILIYFWNYHWCNHFPGFIYLRMVRRMSYCTCLSWHSSGCSSVTHPAPQISTGNFSHFVSPTNLPGCFSMYFVVQEDSYTVLHCSGPWPLQTFSNGV